MGLRMGRISVEDPRKEKALEEALVEVGCGLGEHWTARITTDARAAWELVLEGPQRFQATDPGWRVSPRNGAGARYRRFLRGESEKSVEFVKSIVRQLLWESIQFGDNPIWSHDARLGQAFEQAVWTVLRDQQKEPVHVRFNVWQDEPDGLRFVCKVEAVGGAGSDMRQPPWRWWSPLVQTPDELGSELEQAMARRQRRETAPASFGGFKPTPDPGRGLPL